MGTAHQRKNRHFGQWWALALPTKIALLQLVQDVSYHLSIASLAVLGDHRSFQLPLRSEDIEPWPDLQILLNEL